jgi:hypothetical protein
MPTNCLFPTTESDIRKVEMKAFNGPTRECRCAQEGAIAYCKPCFRLKDGSSREARGAGEAPQSPRSLLNQIPQSTAVTALRSTRVAACYVIIF